LLVSENQIRSGNLVLNFNIKKAKAAAAYLIERSGGSQEMFFLIKMLYYADRLALTEWGNSITGDSFASLKKGPIVSEIYNFMKDPATRPNQNPNEIEWRESFGRTGNNISLRKAVEVDVLSEREIYVLEKSRKTIGGIRGSVANWLHDNCPEWEDPHGSSIPIDPATILRIAGRSDEEINEIEQTNKQVQFLSLLMNAH
jgi:uncharacterized phage-associated protein